MNAPWTPNASAKRRFRDYHKRQYGNPLFPSRRGLRGSQQQPGAWKQRALIALVTVAVGSVAWELFWSPTFRIMTVQVNGATPSTESRIRDVIDTQRAERSLLIFPQSSVFLFDKAGATNSIEALFHLESLKLTKKLPGTLVIDVTEIPKRALLYENKRFFAVSETGTVIRELTDREVRGIVDLPPDIAASISTELGAQMVDVASLTPPPATGKNAPPEAAKQNGNEFPLLFDEEAAAGSDPIPGDAVFSQPTLALILQANTRLPDLTGNAVRWFTVREQDEAVDVTLEGDWHLYLTTTLPFEVQGERLGIILKEKVGADRPRLNYIDLRYNERIFIKLKDVAPTTTPPTSTPKK